MKRATAIAARLASWYGTHLFLRLSDKSRARESLGRRLRQLMETSGVTAIKIGQYLAIRIDLLPAEVCRELSRLLDSVPPMHFSAVRAVVEHELGASLEELFEEFEVEPIGAASIAQVHRTLSREGVPLAVKVQRPDVATTLAADFRILRRLAGLADRLGLFGSISAVDLVGEIAAYTLREVDFEQEGRTADRLRADAMAGTHVPFIDWRLSSPRVLTMELIDGRPLAAIFAAAEAGDRDAFGRTAPGVPPEAIAERLSRAFLRQLFVTGVFQGDPHPANVLIERDGTVAFIDFGIFGELSDSDRATLRRYVRGLAVGRIEAAFAEYAALVSPTADTDMAAYRRETLQIMADWHRSAGDLDLPRRERLTAHFQGRMFQAMRRHGVRMRGDLVLFWRAVAVLDSTAQQMPVRFNLLAAMRRFFAEQEPSLPEVIHEAVAAAWRTAAETASHLPRAAAAACTGTTGQRHRVQTALSAGRRREESRSAKLVALAGVGWGAGVAAFAAGFDGIGGPSMALIAVLCFVAAAQRAIAWR